MNENILNILRRLVENYPQLEPVQKNIALTAQNIVACYQNGGKLLLCGNGGSAADCEHIAGELLKGFTLKRPLPRELREVFIKAGGDDNFIDNLQGSLPTIALTSHISLLTAFANDVNSDFSFAQQLYGLGNNGDILIAISTSGNAKNVVNAVITAKAKNIMTIALTGESGGKLSKLCDISINAPSKETYRIQEFHLPIYHAICEMVEKSLYTE